ncbi:Ig-like domain-containing protein, partial [Ewingella americana]|uniref:Ig-like domain-containing protein n=1 Tax=Ewingella americana TaxID=41202 RepID=UPI00139AF99E
DGKATATLVSNTPGNGKVTVTLTEQDLKTDSQQLTFSQNADIRLAVDQIAAKADGAETVTFTYTAKDTGGKPLANRTLAWTNTNALGDMKEQQTTTDGNGQATAKLTSLDAGKAKLAVSLKNQDGTEHANTPSPEVDFTLSVTANIQEDKTTALADGYQAITVTYTATDAQKKPVANAPITWGTTVGTLGGQPATTDKDGKATATLVSNTPGNGNVSVTLTEQDLKTDSRTLTFAQNATLRLEPNQLTAKANGAETVTFTFTAKDAGGKALTGRTLAWTNTNALGDMKEQQTTTDGNGQATAKLTSLDAGKAKLAVSLKNQDGTEHANTPSPEVDFTLSVTANIQEDKTTALADGYQAITVTYTATDAQKKPVANAPITWGTTIGALGGQPSTTD